MIIGIYFAGILPEDSRQLPCSGRHRTGCSSEHSRACDAFGANGHSCAIVWGLTAWGKELLAGPAKCRSANAHQYHDITGSARE